MLSSSNSATKLERPDNCYFLEIALPIFLNALKELSFEILPKRNVFVSKVPALLRGFGLSKKIHKVCDFGVFLDSSTKKMG